MSRYLNPRILVEGIHAFDGKHVFWVLVGEGDESPEMKKNNYEVLKPECIAAITSSKRYEDVCKLISSDAQFDGHSFKDQQRSSDSVKIMFTKEISSESKILNGDLKLNVFDGDEPTAGILLACTENSLEKEITLDKVNNVIGNYIPIFYTSVSDNVDLSKSDGFRIGNISITLNGIK